VAFARRDGWLSLQQQRLQRPQAGPHNGPAAPPAQQQQQQQHLAHVGNTQEPRFKAGASGSGVEPGGRGARELRGHSGGRMSAAGTGRSQQPEQVRDAHHPGGATRSPPPSGSRTALTPQRPAPLPPSVARPQALVAREAAESAVARAAAAEAEGQGDLVRYRAERGDDAAMGDTQSLQRAREFPTPTSAQRPRGQPRVTSPQRNPFAHLPGHLGVGDWEMAQHQQ
jgi:hypothetical protein